VTTRSLIAAFAAEYRCEDPADGEILQRVGHLGGNVLETLVDAGTVEPSDVLPVGLLVLSALARLCQSSSHSVLQAAPGT
jgi:hypothetical protein